MGMLKPHSAVMASSRKALQMMDARLHQPHPVVPPSEASLYGLEHPAPHHGAERAAEHQCSCMGFCDGRRGCLSHGGAQ